MRKAVLISAALHVAILIVAIVGLPHFLESEQREIVPVPVQMVSESDFDKLEKPEPEKPKPVPKAKPPKSKPKPPAPKPAPPPKAPEPPPAPEPAPKAIDIPKPEPVPEKKPVPPKPVEKPKPPPKPEPKPKPEAKKVEPAKPAPRPRQKPKPPPDQFESLLKNLAKDRRRQEQEKARKSKAAPQSAAADNRPGPEKLSPLQRQMMAAKLAQSIMQQVSPCWNIPAGVKDAVDMQVAIRIRLNPDGALGRQPEIEDAKRMKSDPSFRTVAESALRALRNPSCMPLKLPYDQYDVWKDITFVFDPKEALGQ